MSTGTISNDYDYHHRQDFYDHYQQVTTWKIKNKNKK
jgi:hypothetical protein